MPDLPDIVEGFSGPRGWGEGLKLLGLRGIGLEIDTAACRTAAAAGHLTIQTDVASYPTAPFKGRSRKQIWSPPCQAWSRAGKRGGLADQPLVHQAVEDLAHGRDTRAALKTACKDDRSILAAEPMRWLHDLRPEWVCMEEVPDVLPLWRQYAVYLRGWGYSVWTGILNAADYGVPQTRRRAILIASRLRHATAPTPTHAKAPEPDLFGTELKPWVSMADALGWGATDRPVPTVTAGGGKTGGAEPFPTQARNALEASRDRGDWVLRNGTQKNACNRGLDEPAGTLFFGARCNDVSWVREPDSVRITASEAAILQTFPADYPWQGTKTKQFEQIGNAVPPLLAAHIIAAAEGIAVPASAARPAA